MKELSDLIPKAVVKQLSASLMPFLGVNLDKTYSRTRFDFPDLSQEQVCSLRALNPCERQIRLKEYASQVLEGSFEEWGKDAWIVHRWGGISKFNVGNHDRITSFRDALQQGNAVPFNCISSLSKIAAFVSPTIYFVYDSRVAFALNGLLLDLLEKEKPNILFFPIPSALGGRNIAMNQIITQRVHNPVYYSDQQAYLIYNQLIQQLYQELFPGTDKYQPCRIEMLLFELGKTNGVIAQKVGIGSKHNTSKAKQFTERSASVEDDISSLKEGTVILGRSVHSGYKIIRGGTEIYLFVGKDKIKTFCEVLSKSGQYQIDSKLTENGFERKGGSSPYYIKRFDVDGIDRALSFMDTIKELFSGI